MKTPRLLAALGLLSSLLVARSLSAAPAVIDIWPEGVPGLKPGGGPEKDEGEGRVGNIQHPTLTYFPAAHGNGSAVVICPGGGYSRLAFGHEGIEPARWLNSLGVSAFVLKYRCREYGHPAPLRDVLRAVRWVRSGAAAYGIRPDRIGVLGFSAGGHLAACAGTLYDAPEGRTGAPLDATSGRPDFLILIYPVITMEEPYVHEGSRICLIGEHPSPELVAHLSPELNVTSRTPPAFLVSTEEDKTVPCQNSIQFFEACKKAGVPAELHVFEKGPHGFGLRPGHGAASEWPARCETWLRANGLL